MSALPPKADTGNVNVHQETRVHSGSRRRCLPCPIQRQKKLHLLWRGDGESA
jgi:hypothetical protein